MENKNALNADLEAVKGMIDKLSKGELTIDDLAALEQLTRKLHERSIILRYKAFEKHSGGQVEKEEVIEETIPETVQESLVEEPEVQEEQAFDFSMFEQEEEEPELEEEEIVVDEFQPDIEEHKSVTVSESNEEGENKTEVEITETKSVSFTDRYVAEDNSLASKFSGGKLETLVGAFGLNERLRFINNLFDGSSEAFAEAIKVLDNQEGVGQAMAKVNEFSSQYDWDEEDDSVHELINYVNRRYA